MTDSPKDIAVGFAGLSKLPLAITAVSAALAIGLLVASFSELGASLGLDSAQKRFWVIVAAAVFLAISIGTGTQQVRERTSRTQSIDDNYASLTPGEEFVIKWCISLNRRSFVMAPTHPALKGLIHRGILTCHGTLGDEPITLTIRKDCWDRALNSHMRSEISADFLTVLHGLANEQEMRVHLESHFR